MTAAASRTWTTSSGHHMTAASATATAADGDTTAIDTRNTTATAASGTSSSSRKGDGISGGGNASIENISIHSPFSPSTPTRYDSEAICTSLHTDDLSPKDADEEDEDDDEDDYYIQKKNLLRLQLEANLDPTDAASVFNELNESLTSESSIQVCSHVSIYIC